MRASILTFITVMVVVTVALPAQAERETFPLLDYRTESWFLPQSPGVTGGPAAGLFNPGAFGMTGRTGSDFWWNDRSIRSGLDNYGFGVGRGLNFAMNTTTWGNEVSNYKTYDYQLGLAGGTRQASLGLAYRWAHGETQRRPREQALALGIVSRPYRWASFGTSAVWSLESQAAQYVFDLGVRPLGRHWLTVFADWAVNDDHAFFKDGSWSAGLEVRPVRGLHLGMRARERVGGGGTDISGLVGVTLGSFHAAGMPVWDKDGNTIQNGFLLRSAPPYSGWPVGKPLFGPKQRYLALDLQNKVLTYQKYRYFDKVRVAWLDLLRVLNAVRDDDSYDGVAINMAGLRGRSSLLWELRVKLEELQAAGKRVHIHTDRPGSMVYYVAAVADEVTMDPQGMLTLPGFSLSRSYLKGTLEKLGIGFQAWRYFKYKSAVEILSRDHMSDADREQRQRIVDVLFETVVAGVADGRNISADAVQNAIDTQAMLLPSEALEAGLIDAISRWDQLGPRLLREQGVALTGQPPASLQADTWDDQWSRPPRIPVVFAVGSCDMDTGIRGRATSEYLRKLARDPHVAAVVLRADSPGGDPLPSDLVADAVRQLRAAGKPVIVSQGDVAASGGYWISMDGTEILTTPVTITGSIGVIGGWVWDDGFAGKLGVTSDAVSRGRHADLLTTVNIPLLGPLPRRPMNDEELDRTKKLVLANYDAFVRSVAAGRGLTEEQVRTVAQGRVWMGGDAIEHGLADRFGTLDDAIEQARLMAGVPDWQDVDLVEFPPRKLFPFPKFFPGMPSFMPFGARLESWLIRMDATEPVAPQAAPQVLPGLTPLETEFIRTLAGNNGQPVMMVAPDLLPDGWREMD